MKERITKNRIDYVLQEIAGACIPFSKRNLDSHNKSCIMIVTEPTTPLIFHAQPGGTFSFMGCFMYQYPKQILTITQQVQSYIDAGMVITSRADVEKALKSVGFYRLRGYSFHLYDNATKLATNYQYKSKKENLVKPSQKMLASWIQGVSVLRNMCAHNSRIYNRTIHTTAEILDADKVTPPPVHNGLYQILLAMKYLRSSDEEWTVCVDAFDKLIQNNIGVVSLTAMNLPADWKAHLSV